MNSQASQFSTDNSVMTLYVKADMAEYENKVKKLENEFDNQQKRKRKNRYFTIFGGIIAGVILLVFLLTNVVENQLFKDICLILVNCIFSVSLISLFECKSKCNDKYLNNDKEVYVEEHICGRDLLLQSIQNSILLSVNFNLTEVNSDTIEIRFEFKQGEHFFKYSSSFQGKMQYSTDEKYQNNIVMEVGINKIQVICYYKDKIPLNPFVDFQRTEDGQLVSMTKI